MDHAILLPVGRLPVFLLADTVVRGSGQGEAVALDKHTPAVVVTLSITRILQQESLQVSIWGSTDGERCRRLSAFPPKSYCGTYTMPLDLSREIHFLRIEWSTTRWRADAAEPIFGFQVELTAAENPRVLAAGQ